MLQSSPNIAYLKAAWAAFAGISGSNAGQSYEAAGLSFARINHSTLVLKDRVQVSTMPLHYTRHELRTGFLGRIENEVRKAISQMEAVLLRELCIPYGHELVVELEEGLRQLRRRGHRSLSILIRPCDYEALETRAQIEMRVFLDSPRACLFASLSDASGMKQVDVLAQAPKRTRVPRAAGYAELAQQMAETLNAAVAPYLSERLAA
ncbi:hypothetical protein [Dyella jiangningensis]|uniref:Uncharacterized protein n=1 Tax=Dyella jiangningensis TaxID=1379159 RepID=A0A328P877_9GAMM|nr:hypothetical protein [Dyella jiangningensis]RAO77543.1 hypothetical protein CA260_06630 [Dyella jiangningensis]